MSEHALREYIKTIASSGGTSEPIINLDAYAGTSSTAESTTTKTVSVVGGAFTLVVDAYVIVTFANKTTVNASMNVEDTGSKQVYKNGSRIGSSTSWEAGETCLFQYNGTRYDMITDVTSVPDDVQLAYYTQRLMNGTGAFEA